jgi:hypothetical protein
MKFSDVFSTGDEKTVLRIVLGFRSGTTTRAYRVGPFEKVAGPVQVTGTRDPRHR